MVSSQMTAATFDNTTVNIEAKCLTSRNSYLFRTSNSVSRFPGFSILYSEGRDEADKNKKKSPVLPLLEKGDEVKLLGIFPEQHFTQPPPRFTEASLVKMLEQQGIGRPSTYAPILSIIQTREYTIKRRGNFQPTELGFVINDLLCQYFPNIVNIEFTAHMEQKLDDVAHKNKEWVHIVQDFYTPFENNLNNATLLMEKVKLADEVTDEICPKCGKPMVIKTGRYGRFIACNGYPECKHTKSIQVKVGVNCPLCGSELVERISKKKRIFYGCSNYPNCQFASNSKPLPQPCPKCGSLLTRYRTKWAKCTKCDYKEKLPEAVTEAIRNKSK
jgi:DNA topoisomerase-1